MKKKGLSLMLEEPLHIEEIVHLDKTYYLFNYHRISFLCWSRAFLEGHIPKGNLLITIDQHCDFFIENLKKKHIALAKSLNLKSLRQNIKENNKQDFIVMAMESGIVKDIVVISPVINKDLEFPNGLPKEYTDSSGIIHKATYFDSISDFEAKFKLPIKKPIILDIDLDYFQSHVVDSKAPIEKWKYTKVPTKKQRMDIFKLGTKLNRVYKKANIITLAKEMAYSGGKGDKWAKEFIELFLEF